MEAPKQITPRSLGDYLEVMSKVVMQSGISWAIVEALIHKRWTSHIAGAPGMNSDRRQKLTGRDYTASVKIEMLALAGRLTSEEYANAEVVRKARNKWMHELRPVTSSTANYAAGLAARLYQNDFSIPVRVATANAIQ